MSDTTIRISKETHSKLVAYAAYLTLERNEKVSLAKALDRLLEQSEKGRQRE